MPFLTNCPDLSHTIFTATDLQKAREYLSSVIARVNTSWLKKPKGPLGKHWNSNSPYSACFLIDVARVVYFFEQGITQRSVPLFPSKVNGILVPPSEREFIENLTEFQVASVLVQYIRPLDIDPMVPDEDLLSSSKGQRPKTPDFAFQLPDCKVFLDATVSLPRSGRVPKAEIYSSKSGKGLAWQRSKKFTRENSKTRQCSWPRPAANPLHR
jgi:hypothetical protein